MKAQKGSDFGIHGFRLGDYPARVGPSLSGKLALRGDVFRIIQAHITLDEFALVPRKVCKVRPMQLAPRTLATGLTALFPLFADCAAFNLG
jgi:hypothetical protein